MAVDVDGLVVTGGAAQRRVSAGVEGEALVDPPAVVRESATQRGLGADLLPVALPHVSDVEAAVLPVEREAERVAQAVDLEARRSRKVARIETEDLPKQRRRVLRVVARVAASSAVPGARIQTAVGPPHDHPAVVISLTGMGDARQHTLRACRHLRQPRVGPVTSENKIAAVVHIVDVDVAIRLIRAVESKGEQALLATAAN